MTGFMPEFATKSSLERFVTVLDISISLYCITIVLNADRLQQATNSTTTVPNKNKNAIQCLHCNRKYAPPPEKRKKKCQPLHISYEIWPGRPYPIGNVATRLKFDPL